MLAAYITAHGFGHAARTCDVLAAFRKLYPRTALTVVSQLPAWFLENRLPGVEQRRVCFDVGLVQKDAVEVDLPQTELRLGELLSNWDRLVAQERNWMKQSGVSLVISDIPAIPLEAAAAVKLPGIALGNFGWDWIYDGFRGSEVWGLATESFARAYRLSTCLLRYPFHEEMAAFPKVEELPLVARPGHSQRGKLAQKFGMDESKTWLLFALSRI